jgi:hypothetical protein
MITLNSDTSAFAYNATLLSISQSTVIIFIFILFGFTLFLIYARSIKKIKINRGDLLIIALTLLLFFISNNISYIVTKNYGEMQGYWENQGWPLAITGESGNQIIRTSYLLNLAFFFSISILVVNLFQVFRKSKITRKEK